LALQAHQLLCAYAPQYLSVRERAGWQQDAAEFSTWLADFDGVCGKQALVSAAQLPLELVDLLEKDSGPRPPVMLAGFDRLIPTQRRLFHAWSTGSDAREAPLGEPAATVDFYQAADPAGELSACAIWCRRHLEANSDARLLVVAQDVATRRGEFERTFRRHALKDSTASDVSSLLEFSLGVSLGHVGLARSAMMLLEWLSEPLDENQVDWLLSSGYAAKNPEESLALTAFMRAIRRRGWQRPQWTLVEFMRQRPGADLPAEWRARMDLARRQLLDLSRREQAPLAWAELVPRLLETTSWPGERALTSAGYQVLQRWQRSVDDSASLGFNGRVVSWQNYLRDLERVMNESLFAPESQGAPILIAGPAESAGLTADAVWFLGANEDGWPQSGATHPLLPLAVQREAGMPHAAPQVDWDLAAAMTRRLLSSASEVNFSFARQSAGVDKRPSQIIAQLAGEAHTLPDELLTPAHPDPITEVLTDAGSVPFPPGAAMGGSGILTSQSQCAFKAFAIGRLGAEGWEQAEAGLTAQERGLLLHEVMHRIWGGPPAGIRSHAELAAISNLNAFVAGHVGLALREKAPVRARDNMPPRYLELEAERLTALIVEWLCYERSRVPFAVEQTETIVNPTIAGISLQLRLDRVDRLNDGSLLVVDYKTGDDKPSKWDLPRPEDVQLPLYAEFAVDPALGEVGGLVFAKLRAGKCEFQGKVRTARGTIRSDLRTTTNLVKKPLTQEDMIAWRDEIVWLAEDFLAGRADVDPRKYPETCDRCEFHALCRIQEIRGAGDANGAEIGAEGGDE
jgi:ATP-dependent helicase/nuclease subunit B